MSLINKYRTLFTIRKLLTVAIIFASGNELFCQGSTIHIEIKDGKSSFKQESPGMPLSIFKSYRNFNNSSLLNSPGDGTQRNFIVTTPITVNVTITGSTCHLSNGSVIAIASGGTAPYTYNLSNLWTQNNGNYPEVPGGNYTLTVTDAAGQTTSIAIVVPNSYDRPQLSVSSYTPASGCVTADASITLSASGGTPPYEYSYDMINYQASNAITNLYPGSYYFTVRDVNGCIAVHNSFNEGFLISPSCSNGLGVTYSLYTCINEGEIRLQGYGPNPPYTYSIDGINYQSSGNFTNLTPGYYSAYFKDAMGTIQIFMVPIFKSCTIKIDFISIDAACGQNDGVLTVNASLGTSPYTYTIDGINYQTSNVFTGLAPGIFSVTVKDANGVTKSGVGTVYDRCPEVSLSATNETCIGNDGTITATATKGTAPYQYSIDGINFSGSNVFTGLAAGNYTITLMDALSFTSTASVNVDYSCVSVTTSVTDEICGNMNGTVTAIATSGTAPYQYSIDGVNFQANNVFTSLVAGNYTITVKDFNGQTGNTAVTVNNIQGAQITTGTSPASCENDDGSITVSGTGGKLPLQYSIDGASYQPGNFFNNLSSGTYTVYIKDANGCITSKQVTVLLNCPLVTAIITDETCNNNNGFITVTGTNGSPPYEFSIDGINFQTSTQFSGINAGNYIITIKDAAGITNTTTVSVNNICPVVIATVTDGLCGTSIGMITATGSNGTMPYQYSIDGLNFQAGNIFSNLISGVYTITVKDANGLIITTTAVVNNFPGPTGTVSSSPASCLDNDGTVNFTSSGGSVPLQYSLDGVNFLGSNQFTGIASGNYTGTIKDINGCVVNIPVTVPLNNNLMLDAGADGTICEGLGITLNAVSNGGNFQWTPANSLNNSGLLNPSASPVITTKYIITAKLGSCSLADSVVVNVNPAPIASVQPSMTICSGQNAQLNGSGSLTYQWSPSTYLNDATLPSPIATQPKNSITYKLTVTDGNGCQSLNNASVSIIITPPPRVFAGNDTSIVMNQPFQLMASDVNSNGFVQYKWGPSFGLNNSFVQNPVANIDRNMTYTVTASTAAGCEGSDDINIKVFKGADIFVPTGFTPNQDSKNDILKAIPVGIKYFKYFIIYNRWGEKIFYTNNADKGWDGRYQNIDQQSGVFVWIVEGVDINGQKIQRKGTVMLIR